MQEIDRERLLVDASWAKFWITFAGVACYVPIVKWLVGMLAFRKNENALWNRKV